MAVSEDSLVVDLADGRSISAPLAWYPRLVNGTPGERNNWRLISDGEGIHWPDLDEDLSIESIILGHASAESQASLHRWHQARNRLPSLPDFETARAKYRPVQIKLIFIAEAPPAYESGRFFYFLDVPRGDTLFLEMMKVLYPRKARFAEGEDGPKLGYDPKAIRKQKADFLKQFEGDGFYLVDSVDEPMPEDATPKMKEQKIRDSLPALKDKVAALSGKGNVPVILIGARVFNVCASVLRDESKVRVLSQEAIDFPAQGGQKRFRHKLRRLLASNEVMTTDNGPFGSAHPVHH